MKKLLAALVVGLFATGAFAQTAMTPDANTAPAPTVKKAPNKHHHHHHHAHKKTVAA